MTSAKPVARRRTSIARSSAKTTIKKSAAKPFDPTKPKSAEAQRPRDHEAESRTAAKAHPDFKLIEACVEYGFLSGGGASGFKIDPTDSHFAGPVDCQNCERAEAIITRASKYRPVTLDGLAAKGAAAKLLCDLGDTNYIHDYEREFLQTLAEDVCRFHRLAGGKSDSAPTHSLFAAEPDAKAHNSNVAGTGR
jgi:hypothetical protein